MFYRGLGADETAKLTELVAVLMNSGYPKIVLGPYRQMTDARVTISAWRWQLKLSRYDDVRIVEPLKSHHDGADAPERGVR